MYEPGSAGRPAEVGGIPVFYQVIDEGEIYYRIYLPEQMVFRDDAVVEIAAEEGVLGWFGAEYGHLLAF